jgi:hypothetical protein
MRSYGRYRRPTEPTTARVVVIVVAALIVTLIVSGAFLAHMGDDGTRAEEARYSELCDDVNKLKAEGWGDLSRPVADGEYLKARAAREFSERFGRLPRYKPPSKR